MLRLHPLLPLIKALLSGLIGKQKPVGAVRSYARPPALTGYGHQRGTICKQKTRNNGPEAARKFDVSFHIILPAKVNIFGELVAKNVVLW